MRSTSILIKLFLVLSIGCLMILQTSVAPAQTSQAPPQRPLPPFPSAPTERKVPAAIERVPLLLEGETKPKVQTESKEGKVPRPPSPQAGTAISRTSEISRPVPNKEEQPRLLVSIRTDKAIYKNGERVKIIGKIVNLTGDLKPSVVDLRIVRIVNPDKPPNWEEPDYRVLIEPTSSDFTDENFTIQLPLQDSAFQDQRVEFKVGAEATIRGGTAPSTVVIISFAAGEVGYYRLIKIFSAPIIVVLSFVVLSLSVFLMQPNKRVAKYALWVIYGSGPLFLLVALLGPLLISFSPGTEALIRTTPVGIAKVTTEKIKDLQWTVNIGGVVSDGVLKGGSGIPLFVLIWAMVGGVISMLLKFPEFLRQYHSIAIGVDAEADNVVSFRSNAFKYFIYILTGPFLGAMFYSLLTLLDYTNAAALTVAAFSVGFVSDRVVETIIAVAENILTRAKELFKGGSQSGGGTAGGSGSNS